MYIFKHKEGPKQAEPPDPKGRRENNALKLQRQKLGFAVSGSQGFRVLDLGF